jgi:hypothetical protein
MSPQSWALEEILITVRAAPNPSSRHTETSCVAGVRLRDMKPIRIYPVPARQLNSANQFKKYSIVRAEIQKSSDSRNESYKVNFETIQAFDHVGTGPGRPATWERRNQMIESFRCATSIEHLHAIQDELGTSTAPSLALIRPRRFKRFSIEETEQKDWLPSQLAKLQQLGIFDTPGNNPLEFIPFRFMYHFECDDDACKGHRLSVLDWEITESFRRWRRNYGEAGWREAMRQKYWDELVLQRDLQLYVGTMLKHPRTWTIVGLYYPPQL